MIVSDLRFNDKGKPIVTQRIAIKCDSCGIHYESTYSNQSKNHLKYKRDLCRSCKQVKQYEMGLRNKQKEFISTYSKTHQLGKSYDDIYGTNKASKIKAKISKSISKDNPQWSLKYRTPEEIAKNKKRLSKQSTSLKKNKSYDVQYGKDKSNQIKRKLSECRLGKKNHMYGKPSPKRSGNGWSGWYKDLYFRSLLELSYIVHLIENDIQFKSAECLEFRIKYTYNNSERTYAPDFYLIDSCELIEIKPKRLVLTKQNLAKFDAARKKHGDKFIIKTEEDIHLIEPTKLLNLYEMGDIIFDKKDIIEKGILKIKNKIQQKC